MKSHMPDLIKCLGRLAFVTVQSVIVLFLLLPRVIYHTREIERLPLSNLVGYSVTVS